VSRRALATLPRFVRRLATLLAIAAAAIAVAGCGGSKSSSPLDEAVGYLPKDAPFVVEFKTDLDSAQFKNADQILKKFPFGDQLKQGLKRNIEENDVDFEKDVKPVLGNPLVIGAADPRAVTQGKNDNFIGAFKAKDEDKLGDLVDKEKKNDDGEKNGFKLYRDDQGDSFAVKDDVLVFGGTKGVLEDAIDQRDKDDRMTDDDFEAAVKDLPKDALFRASGDIQSLLKSDPSTADARKVKWVDALRTFGVAGSVESDRLAIDFRVKTDSGKVGDSDLPIASGEDAPNFVQRPGEINVGLRDPHQALVFAQAAAQAVDPEGYGQFEQAKKQIEQGLGVSIDDDIVAQLTGDMSVNFTVDGKYGIRAGLKDPAAFKRTLAKSARVLPRVAKSLGSGTVGLARPKRGEDFYALAQPDGDSVVFGVVNKALVLSNEPARAGRLATESPRSVSGAGGSTVFEADGEKLAARILSRLSSQIGAGAALGSQLFIGPLGDVTGSVHSETDGLTGKFELTFD
jgi:uncharacterized protein DUF3352